jgi:hypothetical protein
LKSKTGVVAESRNWNSHAIGNLEDGFASLSVDFFAVDGDFELGCEGAREEMGVSEHRDVR